MSKIYLPNSTQLDTLNEKLGDIGDTLAGQQLVTKDSVVSALGYEPEVAEGDYVLLNTITITETATLVKITTDSNGDALKLAHLYVVITTDGTLEANKSSSTYVDFGSTSAYLYPSVTFYKDTKCYTVMIAHAYGARKEYNHIQYDKNYDTKGAIVASKSYTKVTPGNVSPITGLCIYSSSGIPVGVTFAVYGIRA